MKLHQLQLNNLKINFRIEMQINIIWLCKDKASILVTKKWLFHWTIKQYSLFSPTSFEDISQQDWRFNWTIKVLIRIMRVKVFVPGITKVLLLKFKIVKNKNCSKSQMIRLSPSLTHADIKPEDPVVSSNLRLLKDLDELESLKQFNMTNSRINYSKLIRIDNIYKLNVDIVVLEGKFRNIVFNVSIYRQWVS